MKFETSIGKSTKDTIYNHGYNLTEDLIGKVSLVDMAFIDATHRMPNKNESAMLDAIMVAICEHGFTPSSVSSRLTYLGAPVSITGSNGSRDFRSWKRLSGFHGVCGKNAV
ncbi:hypothetical protein F7731_22375 [Cytobacillus depressus]|uniref:Uncharacterized protein n=1 Tax=Cytobacillus depressus TaxID=1602942 RepID=A0A6L3UZA3_9BACI|nr:hypothetical protein [Cytobacillus depressus]KAB2329590.1 hypothetical protein F7731_22375 [Cytobacillus depressus]